jgi:hypothetical protein
MLNNEQRKYYKIFTGSNQNEGTDKIYLGFEGYTSELTLKKDIDTYFHVPFFATGQLLNESTLVADGALPGPIPAMADRIFKKQSEYGKTTPWGTTTQIPDGSWLCSWLYAVSEEEPLWLDRYYNPGKLSLNEALEQDVSIFKYNPNDNDIIFYDVPSTMILDPGVYYYYQHQGEKTAKDLVQTFGGLDNNRLRLNLDNWSASFYDDTIYKNKVTINSFKPTWILALSSNEYTDRNVLNFDNTDYIECQAAYSDTYNLSSEFTLNFWLYHKNWAAATYTQLAGNINRGGYGVIYNNLKDYPYWVIPDSTLGHLFYINQENNIYKEKGTQFQIDTPMQITFAGVNLDNEVIVLDQYSNKILKYNHLGDVIDSATTIGSPKTGIINGEGNTIVLTTSGTYIYDPSLTLIESVSSEPYLSNTHLAYYPDGTLVRQSSSLDVKVDFYRNKWSLDINGALYCNDVFHSSFLGTLGTNLAIDPFNNLWVTTTNSLVYKFDTFTKEVIEVYRFGSDVIQLAPKRLTFAYNYNRATNSSEWSGYIINSYDQKMYQFNLDGDLIKVFDLPLELDINNPITAAQNTNDLKFTATGDYSGYELRRIFYPIIHNNKHQLQFKIMAKHRTERKPDIYFNLSLPVDYFANNSWHLVTCIYENQELKMFIDGVLRDKKTLPTNYEIVYTYKNSFFVGTPPGRTENLNYEINSTSVIWNGYIDNIKIYDYAIKENFIQTFLREKIIAQNIIWNIPTAPLQYIEGIERMFKHRLPGHKSSFFKIKLSGTKITNTEVRARVEKEIVSLIERIKPVYSKLLSVEWLD